MYRLREHHAADDARQGGDDGVRGAGYPSDAHLPVQHGQSAVQLRAPHLHEVAVLLSVLQLRLLLL